MRMFVLVWALGVASMSIACGGATPPPKDSDDAVASGAPKPSGHPAAEEGADAAPAGDPLAGSTPPTAKPAPASPGSGSPGGDDPWMASHQMPPKDILHGARSAQSKAQACFRAGVKRDPSTSGEVKIRFVITNDGAVRVWRDEGSSMSDGEVITCIGEVVKAVKFPKQKSPGDAWGIYSVNFSN